MPKGRSFPLPLGMYLRRTSRARYALRFSRPSKSARLFSRFFSYCWNVIPSTPLAASFRRRKKLRRRVSRLSRRYKSPKRCCLCVYAFSAMARRKVCQSLSVVLTALVSCADCVALSVPSPVSGLAPCLWILWADPTPGASGVASCRCATLPAWPS